MIYDLFSINDKVAETYSAPSMYLSKDIAIRDLKYVVNSDPKMMSMAGDLVFYKIGCFDPETGILKDMNHQWICNISDLVEKE